MNLHELIETVLARPRADRAAVMERIRESLEDPEAPGGITVEPKDLVEYGARYVFPRNTRYEHETVTLTALSGPTLPTRWGAVAIADPWYPEAAPTLPAANIGMREQPTALTVITRTRRSDGAREVCPVAATVGAVERVAVWRPLSNDGQFQLDSDSSLGAFYEITDAATLQPLFEDDDHMQAVFQRAIDERILALEVDGRTVASVFVCGKDLHPAWIGYDADGVGIALMLDLGLLAHAQGRAAE